MQFKFSLEFLKVEFLQDNCLRNDFLQLQFFKIKFLRCQFLQLTIDVSAVPKSTSSGVVTGAGGTGSMTGAAGNMTPILNNQYIMGQGVPYAFHQPVYSYEDIQLMQQRIPPHMVSRCSVNYIALFYTLLRSLRSCRVLAASSAT